jgi:FkbM family methyltransferase
MRGKIRLTFLLAKKFNSLHSVPIVIDDCAPVYMDLRLGESRDWLQGTPWKNCPRETAEQIAMRRVVIEGSVAFDIGANLGLHTTLLSSLVGKGGRVFVFEPNPGLQANLARTVAGLGNAVLLSIALFDQRSTNTLFVPEDHSMASLADWTKGRLAGAAQSMSCETHRMDDLIDAGDLPQPDFIKCDVEGAELKVFQGARRVLDRADAPVILFEENLHTSRGFGLNLSAARDFLTGLALPNYRLFEVKETGELAPSEAPNPVAANVLAVPRSKLLLL